MFIICYWLHCLYYRSASSLLFYELRFITIFFYFSANPHSDVRPAAEESANISEPRRKLHQRHPPQTGLWGFPGRRRHRPTARPGRPHVLHRPRSGPDGDGLLREGAVWRGLLWRWDGLLWICISFNNLLQNMMENIQWLKTECILTAQWNELESNQSTSHNNDNCMTVLHHSGVI